MPESETETFSSNSPAAQPVASWGGGAPAARTPDGGGWLGAGPEGDGAWSDTGTATPLSSMVDHAIQESEAVDQFEDESWVDDEALESEIPDYDFDDFEPDSQSSGLVKGLVAALMVLVLGSGFFLLKPASTAVEATAEEKAAASLAEAGQLLQNANEEFKEGKPLVAGAIAIAASERYTDAGDEHKEKAIEARALAADYYYEGKAYQKALDQYLILAKMDGQYIKKYQEVQSGYDKEQRIKGNGLMTDAKASFGRGDYNATITSANHALRLYEDHTGSTAQLAAAHALLGRAYYESNDLGSAKDHLKKAVNLHPGAGYETHLNAVSRAMTPTRRRVEPRTTVIVPEPTNKYPTRTAPVQIRSPRRSSAPAAAPAAAPAPQARRQAPAPQPRRTSRKQPSRLRSAGGNNGLKSYYNTYQSSFSK